MKNTVRNLDKPQQIDNKKKKMALRNRAIFQRDVLTHERTKS